MTAAQDAPTAARCRLEEARKRLRTLLKESRATLDSSKKSITAMPMPSFQFTPSPTNVTVSVLKFDPCDPNQSIDFLPIMAESRYRQNRTNVITVIEITSHETAEDDEFEETVQDKIPPTVDRPGSSTSLPDIEKSANEPEDKQTSDDGAEEEEKPKEAAVEGEVEPPKEVQETQSIITQPESEEPKAKRTTEKTDADDDSSSSEVEVTLKAPTTWPELPKKVDPESVKTAQDKEWWDDEILRCSIAHMKREELTAEQTEDVLVYSPLEVISLLYAGEVESPPSYIKRIFLPLHVDGTHWCLLEISASPDRQALLVTLLDSLPILNTAEWFQFRWQEVNRAIEGLARCKVFNKLGWKAKDLLVTRIDRRQTNIYDCGPYTVEFLKRRILGESGEAVSGFEAAMRRETVKEWLESDEVEVPLDKATLERIKAETEAIAPSQNATRAKSRIRGRISAIFDS
jgi:hypothetical protein